MRARGQQGLRDENTCCCHPPPPGLALGLLRFIQAALKGPLCSHSQLREGRGRLGREALARRGWSGLQGKLEEGKQTRHPDFKPSVAASGTGRGRMRVLACACAGVCTWLWVLLGLLSQNQSCLVERCHNPGLGDRGQASQGRPRLAPRPARGVRQRPGVRQGSAARACGDRTLKVT